MRICLWQRVVQCGIVAKRRKFELLAASCLAPLSLGLSEPALAQTFTTAGNDYLGGINVNTNNTPINVTLDPGVQVFIPANTINNAVGLSSTTAAGTGGPINLIANNAAISINTAGISTQETSAIRLQAGGNATIMASGIMNVTGTNSTNAVWANVFSSVPGAVATVNYDGSTIPGTAINAVGGPNSTVIQACANDGCGFGNFVDGNAIINAAGNLKGAFGDSGFGLDAVAGGANGTAIVNYDSGTINLTAGSFSDGIFATAGGSATITTLSGTTIIVSSMSAGPKGVEAFSESGATLANVASTIQVTGNPTPAAGDFRFQPAGIQLQSNVGPASVNYTGPGITVHGGGGVGIAAVSGNTTASGPVTVDAASGGPIVADGSDPVGILADSGILRNTIRSLPPNLTGQVQVTASNVSTPGQFGTAISANGGSGGVTVNIAFGGSIMGGWQATPFTSPATPLLPGTPPASVTPAGNISSVSGLPAAGVFLSANGAGTATLTNNGSIGALSDLAIVGDLGNSQVTNNDTITGFVKFTGDNNNIVNNGTFDLRHFADTTGATDAIGNGVRDTLRLAVADLGTGPNNTFTNNGTLALPAVTGATTLDPRGQYLPLGIPNNSMAFGGPLQGQLLGVTTFTNSGIIDLQANPAAGDVLLITGGHTPGTNGGGTYISNGGFLKLDTVLNEGLPTNSQSDVLVVDGTTVGPNGATKISILNAGGAGAFTPGDGILVVQVLDPTRSAAGAFTLLNPELRAGDFDYRLFQGGINGSNPADWFLRNDFIVGPPTPLPPTPVAPGPEVPIGTSPPPGTLPPGVYPIIGPELATYGVVQPIARQMGLTTLGTLHERIGDTLATDPCQGAAVADTGIAIYRKAPVAPIGCAPSAWVPSVWARGFGQQVSNHYQAFADPRADGNLVGMQSGFDLWRGALFPSWGRDVAGLFFAYSNANIDVNGLVTNPAATGYVLTKTGTLNLNAWSGGAYWTHYGPTGWYLDLVLQGTDYAGGAQTQFAKLTTDGWGFISSLEAGYPIPVLWLGPGFVLEPQAQILWQQVSFNSGNDGLGDVALGTTTGTTGRIGVRAKWTILGGYGQVWEPYVRVNLWQDWGGQATTTFSGIDSVPLLERATLLETSAGLTARFNTNWSLYAQGGYQFALNGTDGGRRDGVKGDLGLRYTW